MSPPAPSTKGENGGVKRAKPEESTHSSDTNGGSNTGDNSSMKVQDFMSFLAKESNITNMTVETNDGRRISATFKDGLPAPLSTPANGADASATKEASSSGATGKNGKTPMMSPTRDIAKTMTLMGAENTASTTCKVSIKYCLLDKIHFPPLSESKINYISYCSYNTKYRNFELMLASKVKKKDFRNFLCHIF